MVTPRNIVLLLVAVLAAVGTALYTKNWMAAERAQLLASLQPEEPVVTEAVEVLVVDQTLTAGSFVQKDHLKWVPWPEDGVGEDFILRRDQRATQEDENPLDQFKGAVVRHTITKGEPITALRVVQPGDRGFLAAVLEPGMRAVSVPVDATTGISGFIFPGDWVDVLFVGGIELTKFKDAGEEDNKKTTLHFSQTLLSDVRVLALDQKVENVDGEVKVADTATLQVSAKDAEKISLGLRLGKLSLTLHSLAREQDRYAHIARAVGATEDKARSYTLEHEMLYMLNDPRFKSPRRQAGPPPVTVFRAEKIEKVKN